MHLLCKYGVGFVTASIIRLLASLWYGESEQYSMEPVMTESEIVSGQQRVCSSDP